MLSIVKKISLVLVGVLVAMNTLTAQNYKAAKIDASGKITDSQGKYIGSVNKAGEITNAEGVQIAHVDANGILVDAKTGKKLGKAEKNGNYVPYFMKSTDHGWSTGAPMNGTCIVKDKDGNVKAEVHENYKQFGACAIHCLQHHMKHDEMLDMSEKKDSTQAHGCKHHDMKAGKCAMCGMDMKKNDTDSTKTHHCSMHHDMQSNKAGKCSKCGMDMKKK